MLGSGDGYASRSHCTNTDFILSDTDDETVSVSSGEMSTNEKNQWQELKDDIYDYMTSAINSFASGVAPEHLSKVWRISHDNTKELLTIHLSC